MCPPTAPHSYAEILSPSTRSGDLVWKPGADVLSEDEVVRVVPSPITRVSFRKGNLGTDTRTRSWAQREGPTSQRSVGDAPRAPRSGGEACGKTGHTPTCTCAYVHVCVYVNAYVCECVHVCEYGCVCECVCMRVYEGTCVDVSMGACVHPV